MAIGVNIHEVKDYVLKCDRELPKEQQSIFKVGFYSSVVNAFIKDKSIEFYNSAPKKEDSASEKTRYSRKAENKQEVEMRAQSLLGTQSLLTVKYGLRGFSNFKLYEKGNLVEIEFKTHKETINGEEVTALDSSVLDALGEYIDELADAINDTNTISSKTEKN